MASERMGRWSHHRRWKAARRPRADRPGERRVRGRLAPPPRVARPDAAEDLAEPLERGDGPGRQEVVDVRVGGPHPAGQRLVAGRAGQWVEPDEAVAVAPEARGLGRDERRVAAVPAVRHDDDDPRRPQRAPRPLLVERPERLADPRAAGPVVDRVGDPGERAIAVAVAEQPRDAGEPRPEHERLRPHLGRGRQRLDEPQQQPRVALHRARDVAQDHERAWLADLASPDPRDELAAGPEVAPEHRARRQATAVRMELVAARPPAFQARHEQVDQALRLAQLGRRHPVELAVAQDLALRVRVGRDDDALDRCLVVGVVAVGRDRRAALVGTHLGVLVAGLGRSRAGHLLLVGRGVLARQRRRSEVARQPRTAPAPPAIEGGVIGRPVVAPPDEDRGAGRADLLAVGDVDQGQGTGEVHRRTEVDRQPSRPERASEPDRLAEQPPAVDLGSERGADDRGIGRVGHAGAIVVGPVSRRPPPRTGSVACPRRGPGGCPPRT